MPSSRHPAKPSNADQYDSRPLVSVLGTGADGAGLSAGILASQESVREPNGNGNGGLARPVRVSMWGHSADESGRLAQTRRSPRLEGFLLPEEVSVVLKDAPAVKGTSLIVSAIPVQYIRDVWTRLAPHVPTDAAILSVAKGVENTTMLRPTQVINDVLHQCGRDDPDGKPRRIGCLSGPTIAAELARKPAGGHDRRQRRP